MTNNFDPDLQIFLAPVFDGIANQILKNHCELGTIRHQRWQLGYTDCCAGLSEVMCQVCQRDLKRLFNRDELRLLRRYAQRRLPVMIGAETAFSWTHAADAAAGHWLAATQGRPGETYFLAGPALSYHEFFSVAERATGLPAPRLWLPAGLARLLARWLRRARPGLADVLRSFSGLTYLARSDKAQRELGWQARPVEAGLAQILASGL